MTTKIPSRYEWDFGGITDPFTDKQKLIKSEVTKMLNKTLRMFKYNNLPDTIPQKDLELLLQVNGYAVFTYVPGKGLYAFYGGLGGIPNAYYLPTIATVANPYLKFNANLNIDENCIVMRNDDLYQGLMPTLSKYATLLIEAETSLRYALINTRVPAIVQADNDNTYKAATEFFKKVTDGTEFGVIPTKEFFAGLATFEFAKNPQITQIIEATQYIKGSFYNEIGLNAAFNMKREAINEAEASLNEDILYPTIDTMLTCRRNALEKINAMFDTNITVDLDSVWKQNDEQEELAMDIMEAEANPEQETDTKEKGETDDETD